MVDYLPLMSPKELDEIYGLQLINYSSYLLILDVGCLDTGKEIVELSGNCNNSALSVSGGTGEISKKKHRSLKFPKEAGESRSMPELFRASCKDTVMRSSTSKIPSIPATVLNLLGIL